MESLRNLYRIGPGPSSSHTLAVQRICRYYLDRYPDEKHYDVTLYGSLSLTGKGHGTDKIIEKTIGAGRVSVHFAREERERPNTMTISDSSHEMTFYSVGGGAFEIKGVSLPVDKKVYPEESMEEILWRCEVRKQSLYEYVLDCEPDIREYLGHILGQMFATIESGLQEEGVLPGKLKLRRVAKDIYRQAEAEADPSVRQRLLITAYAYACSEENAAGNNVVTAPTMGSCGVIPSVLYWHAKEKGVDRDKLVESLAVAGIFGNLVKDNATISGSEGGCQAEIGTACAMAAAAVGWISGLSAHQIAYAAEIGIEHNLGLTCDPVEGYVMIPCIERNGIAALRAMDAALYADHIGKVRPNKVSFDQVVQTMKYTGKKIARELRETSLGGLAKVVR